MVTKPKPRQTTPRKEIAPAPLLPTPEPEPQPVFKLATATTNAPSFEPEPQPEPVTEGEPEGSVPTPLEIVQAIRSKAESECHELQKTLASLEIQANMLASEKASILESQQVSTRRITDRRQIVDKLLKQHAEATSWASVAHGTIAEQEAVKQLSVVSRQVETEREQFNQDETEHISQTDQRNARLSEIERHLETIANDIFSAQAKLQDVVSVRDRAIAQLGQGLFDELYKRYQDQQSKIDEIKRQLIAAQVEQAQFLDSAVEKLTGWPGLVKKIRDERPFEDATTRVLGAAIAYLEELIRDGASLSRGMSVPLATNYYSWWLLLALDREEIDTLHSRHGSPALKQHLRNLQTLQSQYVASKR